MDGGTLTAFTVLLFNWGNLLSESYLHPMPTNRISSFFVGGRRGCVLDFRSSIARSRRCVDSAKGEQAGRWWRWWWMSHREVAEAKASVMDCSFETLP